MNASLLFILGFLGALLLAVGWRGRRINDHPTCTRCGFDLIGTLRPGHADSICPECGQGLALPRAVRRGQRRQRPTVLVLGVGTLVVSAGLGVWWLSAFDRRPHTPSWVLLLEIDYGESRRRVASLREVLRRVDEGQFRGNAGAVALSPFIRRALERQADDSRPWRAVWGDLIESAYARDLVSDEDWDRYVHHAVKLTLHPRTPLRVGDPVVFMIEEEYRLGQQSFLELHMRCSVPRLEVAASEAERVRAVPPVGDEASLWPSLATVRSLRVMSPGHEYWRIESPHDTNLGDAGSWPVALNTGAHQLRITVSTSIDFVPGSEQFLARGNASGSGPFTNVHLLEAALEIASAEEASLQPRHDEKIEAQMASTIWIDEVHSTGDRYHIITLRCSPLPYAIAAEAFVSVSGREWPLGFVTTHPTASRYGDVLHLSFGPGSAEALSEATLILRPSENAARGTTHIWEYYGGEIYFDGLEVQSRPRR